MCILLLATAALVVLNDQLFVRMGRGHIDAGSRLWLVLGWSGLIATCLPSTILGLSGIRGSILMGILAPLLMFLLGHLGHHFLAAIPEPGHNHRLQAFEYWPQLIPMVIPAWTSLAFALVIRAGFRHRTSLAEQRD